MKSSTIFTFVIILILTASCSPSEQQVDQEELVKTVNVEAETLETQPFERYLKLVGSVEARNDARISAEVAGRIEEYFVEKGESVKKGEPIAKIDDAQLIRERERLEAVTAQSKENYERLKRLYEEEGIGSEIDFLNAKYNYEQNKASLEATKVNIEKTTVNAPFNANIEDILIEEGEMVSPGSVMVRLIGSDQLKVSAGVPARFADVVAKGDRAEVWFDFTNSDTMYLPISFVGSSIDQQARTFEVEITLPSEAQHYKVDMIANVRIRTLQADDALVVGEEFIYQKEDGYIAYTVGQDSAGHTIAREVPIKLGASYENKVIIKSGLNAGERLITVGSSFLQNNMRINIVENRNKEFAQNN